MFPLNKLESIGYQSPFSNLYCHKPSELSTSLIPIPTDGSVVDNKESTSVTCTQFFKSIILKPPSVYQQWSDILSVESWFKGSSSSVGLQSS